MYEQAEREQYKAKRAVPLEGVNTMGLSNQGCDSSAGMLNGGGGPLRRSNIRQRIAQTLVGVEDNLRRAHAAQRAQTIIDAHPEFAELLDLLNEF